MKTLFIICIITAIVFTACSGQNCLSIGGSYEGAEGNLQYCWNEASSKEAGVPVLESANGNNYLIDEASVTRLNELYDKAMKTETENVSNKTQMSQIKMLLLRIKHSK